MDGATCRSCRWCWLLNDDRSPVGGFHVERCSCVVAFCLVRRTWRTAGPPTVPPRLAPLVVVDRQRSPWPSPRWGRLSVGRTLPGSKWLSSLVCNSNDGGRYWLFRRAEQSLGCRAVVGQCYVVAFALKARSIKLRTECARDERRDTISMNCPSRSSKCYLDSPPPVPTVGRFTVTLPSGFILLSDVLSVGHKYNYYYSIAPRLWYVSSSQKVRMIGCTWMCSSCLQYRGDVIVHYMSLNWLRFWRLHIPYGTSRCHNTIMGHISTLL